MFEYAVNLLGIVFELYIANLFFSKISKRKVSKKILFAYNIPLALLQLLNNILFLKSSSLVMLFSVLVLFLCSLLYDNKFLSKIFSSLFILLVYVVSEFIVAMISTNILKMNISVIQNSIVLFSICTLTSKFLAFTLISILKYEKKETRKNWFPFSIAAQTLLLPLSSFIVLMLLLDCSYKIEDTVFTIITLISSCLLLLSNILIFYLIDKQNDYIETKERLKFAQSLIDNQISHYEELYKYQNEIKTFRHDTKNRLIALAALIDNKETQKALDSINRDLALIHSQSDIIVNSGNPIIDAVIQSKIKIAQEKNIEIEHSIKLNEKIQIDEMELSVLIGNALDNAIESTEKIDATFRIPIEFKIICIDNRISLSIKNQVTQNVDINSLSTTKANKNLHGYGIGSMKTIAQKYAGEIFFSCTDNIFELTANLNNAV